MKLLVRLLLLICMHLQLHANKLVVEYEGEKIAHHVLDKKVDGKSFLFLKKVFNNISVEDRNGDIIYEYKGFVLSKPHAIDVTNHNFLKIKVSSWANSIGIRGDLKVLSEYEILKTLTENNFFDFQVLLFLFVSSIVVFIYSIYNKSAHLKSLALFAFTGFCFLLSINDYVSFYYEFPEVRVILNLLGTYAPMYFLIEWAIDFYKIEKDFLLAEIYMLPCLLILMLAFFNDSFKQNVYLLNQGMMLVAIIGLLYLLKSRFISFLLVTFLVVFINIIDEFLNLGMHMSWYSVVFLAFFLSSLYAIFSDYKKVSNGYLTLLQNTQKDQVLYNTNKQLNVRLHEISRYVLNNDLIGAKNEIDAINRNSHEVKFKSYYELNKVINTSIKNAKYEKIDYNPKENFEVLGYRSITNIIDNLIQNAIEENTTKLKENEIKLELEVENNILKLKVITYNAKIAHPSRIFEYGFSTKEGNNRGKGLWLVYEACKDNGYLLDSYNKNGNVYFEVVFHEFRKKVLKDFGNTILLEDDKHFVEKYIKGNLQFKKVVHLSNVFELESFIFENDLSIYDSCICDGLIGNQDILDLEPKNQIINFMKKRGFEGKFFIMSNSGIYKTQKGQFDEYIAKKDIMDSLNERNNMLS